MCPWATIVVQPGEKVPLDGVVLEGSSTLNTAALTGESLPRDVTAGDEIVSGCINMTGVLKIRTTRAFGESTVSKIWSWWKIPAPTSPSLRTSSPNLPASTPAVCIGALVLAVLPPVVRLVMGLSGDWGTLGLPRPDLPGHQLPLRAGHQHPAELLRRNRRCQPGRRSGEGLQLSGNPVQNPCGSL